MILLIFEQTDTPPHLYLLDDLSDEEMRVLRLAHGNYLNTAVDNDEEEQALEYVNDALSDNPEYALNEEWACRWADKRIESGDEGFLSEPLEFDDIIHVGAIW